MKFSLIPKDYLFFDLFDQMASHATEAALCFKDFSVAGTFDHTAIEKMHLIEESCDDVTHEIIDRLNRTFITPFDREDIYSLAHEFDSVVDIIQAMTNRMLLYKLNNAKNEDLIRFAELIEKSVDNLSKAVRGLRNLKEPSKISSCCIEVNRLENLGDHLRDEVLSKLFANAPDPMNVIKWKDIYMEAETVLDKCEDVANIAASILIKQG
jgi:uncharacterized protein Yka (UPF0111/DUF47 family)